MHGRIAAWLIGSAGLHGIVVALILQAASATLPIELPQGPLAPVRINVAIRAPQLSAASSVDPAGVAPDAEQTPVLRPKAPAFKAFLLRSLRAESIAAHTLLPDLISDNATSYLATSMLSVRPKSKSDPELVLPPGWLEAFGLARLTLYISAEGKVDSVTFVRTDLPLELQGAVRDAFQKVAFSPGEIDGRAVATMITIETNIALLLGHRH